MKNIWGYNGKYKINENGEIYSIHKKRFLVPTISVRGYHVVNLDKKIRPIHQLLAETFIDKHYKKKKLVVDHIDRNPLNNSLANIRVTTKSENGKNVTRPFSLCIFKREDSGHFRVKHNGFDKTFRQYLEALKFRMELEKNGQ